MVQVTTYYFGQTLPAVAAEIGDNGVTVRLT